MSDLQAVGAVAAAVVGGLFIHSGWTKAADVDAARNGILDYRLLPARMAGPTAITIAACEIAVGLGSLMGIAFALTAAGVLLAVFSFAVGFALMRKLKIDCHCGGASAPIGWRTLARNLGFAVLVAIGIFTLASADQLVPASLSLTFVEATTAAMLVAIVAASAVTLEMVKRLPGGGGLSRRV